MIRDIVAAGIAHANVISALHKSCFETAWEARAVVEILAMPGAFALIGNSDDCPQGFVLFRLAADEAEIISIGVSPNTRRAGLAGRLLQASIDHATKQKCVKMFLEVAEDNTAACALYEKFGFLICGRRPGYYDHEAGKTDALLYSLEITAK